tara:strand:- start:107 stop:388 length:282 start_codon:yes stop_codon:yes gene_type:complete
MKKIKLTVLTLLLGGMCYSQTQVQNDSITKLFAYIESVNTIQDMIEWMKSDIDSEVIDKDYGETYIENLVGLLSRLEDINAGYIDCENCDEID